MAWLLALLLAAAEPAAPPPGGYAVVRKDGSVTWLLEAPVQKGTSWVGKLSPGGQLVSFPAAEVDVERTREANRKAPATPTPGVVPFEKKAPRKPTPTPAKKLRKSREEAEKALSALSGEPGGGAASQKSGPRPEEPSLREAAPVEPPETFEPTDRNGRGEEWWRDRAERVRQRLREAERELADAQVAAASWDRNPEVWGTEYWAMELSRLRTRVEKARIQVDEARRRWSDLEEDARKAGAWPGWLR